MTEGAVVKEDNNNKSLIGVLLTEFVTKIIRSNEIMEGRLEVQPDLKAVRPRVVWEDIGAVRGEMCSPRKTRPGLLALEKPPHGGNFGDGCSGDEFPATRLHMKLYVSLQSSHDQGAHSGVYQSAGRHHLCDPSADRECKGNRSTMPSYRHGQAVHVAITCMTRRATTQAETIP